MRWVQLCSNLSVLWHCLSLGLEWRLTFSSPMATAEFSEFKEIQPVHPKDQSWVFIGRTDTEAETPVLWPPDVKSWLIGKDWCWEGLGAGGEGDDRGWDGWKASPTRWTWVWVNSRSWWWTGRPGVLWFMGLQGVRHEWATELNWDICSQVYYVFLNCIFVSRVWALWVLYSTSLVLNFLYVLELLEELLKNPLFSPSS